MSQRPKPEVAGLDVGRAGSLVERVADALALAPLTTERLAADVLGLRGSPGVVARAVFAMLGEDARFGVDAHGVWSLQAVDSPPASSLREEEWVVVDVETTGGSPASGHRITEVAAVLVSGGEVGEVYTTLVNPERRIPSMITSLTGITNEMVAGAPVFRHVEERFTEALRGRVFVAHNASFDWRFVCAEMERSSGRQLYGRQLCTVRLARKLFPNLPSRSLDALADYFGLEIRARHRAADDAVATAHLLVRLIGLLEERGVADWGGLEALLNRRAARRKRSALPRSMDSA